MVHSMLTLKALFSIVGMSLTVDALSFENFVDPLLRNGEELKLEDQLSELGRVLDVAARNLFNLTVGTSATLSHTNAFFVIILLSGVIFTIFTITAMAASSIFTGTSVQSYYGKRSLPDDEGNELNFQWARIIQILHEMDEHFHRLGAEQSEDDCRKRLVCKLFEEHNDSKDANHRQLANLTNELSDIYGNNELDTGRSDVQPFYDSMKAYNEAVKHGRKFKNCTTLFPKCDRY
ncbi:uncharacterized protein LOC116921867 isoform X2 [Daphnia magna]|uniref:uncharacterized protein LOC116921867 isoform X2 n=1 Tax=Daphnia magna TaxID=35525 RepID=UPI00140305EC|nr:uncharacterized protein LOC116921867 isoform X2 [Daphnia magna]